MKSVAQVNLSNFFTENWHQKDEKVKNINEGRFGYFKFLQFLSQVVSLKVVEVDLKTGQGPKATWIFCQMGLIFAIPRQVRGFKKYPVPLNFIISYYIT